VEVCFANPGTSERHLVAALDEVPDRAGLCTFEGVATGAADGDRPAGAPHLIDAVRVSSPSGA